MRKRLGSTLLSFGRIIPARPRPIGTVVLLSPNASPAREQGVGAMVLANAVLSTELVTLVDQQIAARAALLVLPTECVLPDQLAKRAAHSRLAIAQLSPGASWLQLATIVQSMLGGASEWSGPLGTEADADLFDVANSLATIIGGPVTIENMTSRILAFSADQADADEARQRSVLGHQVPDIYATMLHKHGFFKKLYAAETPYFMPSMGEAIRPRVGFRIKAGRELLGSIWVVVDEPLDEHRAKALMEGADMVALSMLRSRTASDAAERLRLGLLMMLLEGGAAAEEAAARLGFAGESAAVLAIGSVKIEADSADTEVALKKIARALVLHLHAAHPLSVVGQVGRTVYGVLPVGTDQTETQLRQIARGFLDRLDKNELFVVGLGGVQAQAALLNASRAEADAALRVLKQRQRPEDLANTGSMVRIACAAEVQIESLMIRLSDQLVTQREPVAGPLATLLASDQQNGTRYLASLAAWLDAFGDIAQAAAACHIHQNTLRYRLARLSELAGIDLSNSQQRFELMLQLRLFKLNGDQDSL